MNKDLIEEKLKSIRDNKNELRKLIQSYSMEDLSKEDTAYLRRVCKNQGISETDLTKAYIDKIKKDLEKYRFKYIKIIDPLTENEYIWVKRVEVEIVNTSSEPTLEAWFYGLSFNHTINTEYPYVSTINLYGHEFSRRFNLNSLLENEMLEIISEEEFFNAYDEMIENAKKLKNSYKNYIKNI